MKGIPRVKSLPGAIELRTKSLEDVATNRMWSDSVKCVLGEGYRRICQWANQIKIVSE